MELLGSLIDIVLHLDVHLAELIVHYGGWIYVILFLIIFAETGFVVTPFLPGDSLLFVAGTVAASGAMNVHGLVLTLVAAAFLGNQTNYAIGRWLGQHWLRSSRFINRAYLERTERFFERHGGKTIVISRWVPIVRTYAPFVAGVSEMPLHRFTLFNAIGAASWIVVLTYSGYWFGNLPFVREHFGGVVIGIVVLSLLPVAFEQLRSRRDLDA